MVTDRPTVTHTCIVMHGWAASGPQCAAEAIHTPHTVPVVGEAKMRSIVDVTVTCDPCGSVVGPFEAVQCADPATVCV